MLISNLFTATILLVAPLVSAAAVPCKTLKTNGAIKYYRRSTNRDHDTAIAEFRIEYGGKLVCNFTPSAGSERIWQQTDLRREFQGGCSNGGQMTADVDGKWVQYKEPGSNGKVHRMPGFQIYMKGKEDKNLMTTTVFSGWSECKADNGWRL